jgi:UDP-glucose 4-epimerase
MRRLPFPEPRSQLTREGLDGDAAVGGARVVLAGSMEEPESGPRPRCHARPTRLRSSLLRGEPPRLMSGDRAVDWIFVADVVEALMAAARARGIDGARIDVGSGELVTVKEIVERLVAIIDPGVEPRFGAVPDRIREQIRVADVRRSESLLGWRPSTPLDEGLRRTVSWYREGRSRE